MGDDKLRVIAHKLLGNLPVNASVDLAHSESARARLRVLVKGILRKYGYPPDLQDVAVQTIQQRWSGGFISISYLGIPMSPMRKWADATHSNARR